MRIAVVVLTVLVLCGALILAVGAMLPVRHVAAVRFESSRPPAEVYATVTNVESYGPGGRAWSGSSFSHRRMGSRAGGNPQTRES